MKEDILHGNYNDPFEQDIFAQDLIDGYEDDVQELTESFDGGLRNYLKKKKRNNEDEIEESEDDPTMGGKYPASRKYREVNVGTEPWTEDQSFVWPDYEAEAFEKALETFRHQGSNTGYESEALLKKLKDKYGQEFVNKTLEREFAKQPKKASARKRFNDHLAKVSKQK